MTAVPAPGRGAGPDLARALDSAARAGRPPASGPGAGPGAVWSLSVALSVMESAAGMLADAASAAPGTCDEGRIRQAAGLLRYAAGTAGPAGRAPGGPQADGGLADTARALRDFLRDAPSRTGQVPGGDLNAIVHGLAGAVSGTSEQLAALARRAAGPAAAVLTTAAGDTAAAASALEGAVSPGPAARLARSRAARRLPRVLRGPRR